MSETIAKSALQIPDPSAVTLQGYAAVTGNTFSQGPFRYRIVPGAFASVLERLGDKPLPIMIDHRLWDLQIGETFNVLEDEIGLWFEGYPFATRDALDALAVIDGRTRMDTSFSFDFGETEEIDGVINIHSFSDLYELGPTTWGANPLAYTELAFRENSNSENPITEPAIESAHIEPADQGMVLASALWRATATLKGISNRSM